MRIIFFESTSNSNVPTLEFQQKFELDLQSVQRLAKQNNSLDIFLYYLFDCNLCRKVYTIGKCRYYVTECN